MKLKFIKYIIIPFSLLVLSFYIICFHHYVTDGPKNKCLMTYMYGYPHYVKVNMAEGIRNFHEKYGLYAYSEGKFIERARKMIFTGIPILFIPGHGGSYKQVRSLASVTTHRILDLQSIFHFDFFSIDFNGEFSALYGGTLKDQHFFAMSCIDKILSLYPVQNKPESVIIIGHSMGGMIARSLFKSESFNANSVKLIITLATPHQSVILIDKDLRDFYYTMDDFWEKEKGENRGVLENITMISIGGGSKDLLVRPGLTFSRFADLNVLTSAIPDVITSTDHLCIVWCNNFVKTLSRALYDAVDIEIKGITHDKKLLKNIFYYHLVHCSNGKYYTAELHQEQIKLIQNEHWREIKQNKISLIFFHGVVKDTYMVISKPKNSSNLDSIMIEAINIQKRDWIAECNAVVSANRSVYCDIGNNLSQFGTVGFNKTLNRKYIRMSFNSEEKYVVSLSHLIVRLPETMQETGLNVDIYNKKSRTVKVNLSFYLFYQSVTIIEKTEQGALTYTIELHGIDNMWKVYRLYLLPLFCHNKKHSAYAVFKTPWNYDSSHVMVNSEEANVLKIILLTIPPKRITNVPTIDLILDPSCRYSVQIDSSYYDSVGVIVTRYSLALLANICAILLLTLAKQYQIFEDKKTCLPFLEALKQGGGPWFIYPTVRLITYAWENLKLDKFFKWDTQLLQDDTADPLIIPLMLYLVSFAVVYVVGLCLWASIVCNVQIFNKYVIRKNLTLRLLMEPWDLDWIHTINKDLAVGLSITILCICWITCGGLGLIAGVVLYYIKICYVYKLCSDLKTSKHSNGSRSSSFVIQSISDDMRVPKMDFIHLHCTLLLIWSLCAVTYLPSTIMWFKNIGFGSSNMNDPSFGYDIVLILSVSFLWYCNSPYTFLTGYDVVSYPIFITSCFLLLMCQVNIYRITQLVFPVFVIISIHQYYYGLISLNVTRDNRIKNENSGHESDLKNIKFKINDPNNFLHEKQS